MLVELSNSEIEMLLEWYGYFEDDGNRGYGTSEKHLDLVEKFERLKETPRPTCPRCGGSGEVQQTDIDWDKCRTCNGSGKI
jgi:DnaJ-class molecular chaperone